MQLEKFRAEILSGETILFEQLPEVGLCLDRPREILMISFAASRDIIWTESVPIVGR